MCYSPGIVNRNLDPVEEALYEATGLLCFAVEYDGLIDIDVLNIAVNRLYAHHPILGSRIIRANEGYSFETRDTSIAKPFPQLIEKKGDIDLWKTEIRKLILCTESQSGELLSRVSLVHTGNHGYLTLCLHHAIVDAHGHFAYMHELMQLYTTAYEDKNATFDSAPQFPESPSKIMVENGFTFEVTNRDANSIFDSHEEVTATKWCIGRTTLIELGRLETQSILQACRINQITFGALILGSIAVSLQNARTRSPGFITFDIGVDQRRNTSPPIRATDVTFLVTRKTIKVAAYPKEGLLDTAKSISTQLRNEMQQKTEGLLLRKDKESVLMKMATSNSDVRLNNWGTIPQFSTPGGISIVNYLPGDIEDKFQSDSLVGTFSPWPYNVFTYSFQGRSKIGVTLHDGANNDTEENIINCFKQIAKSTS